MEDMSRMMNNPDAEARVDLTNDDVVNPVVTESSGKYQTIGSTIPNDLREDDIKVVPASVPTAALAKATGHQVPEEALRIEREQAQREARAAVEEPKQTTSRFMSPSQVAAAGIDLNNAQTVNVQEEAARRSQEQWEASQQASDNALAQILQGAVNSETERNQRLDNTLNADEETRQRLLGDTPIATATRKVTTEEERKRDDRHSTNPVIDPYDLMPGYDDKETEPEVPKAEEEEEPDPGTDEYALFIKNLPVVSDAEPAKGYAVNQIREATVNVIKARPDKTVNNLGNNAFLNAVNSFKRDNFSKVTVPLVNSGFMVDMVGTGVVDLQNLYSAADENMTEYDYQLERMGTVIRNVVGTNPHINPMQLRNSIHFQDYDMMAYGHLCATLKTVETVANCTECGKPFHITSKPINLLLNMDELYDRRVAIENAANIEENSLMTSTRVVNTESDIDITLAHPSYGEMVRSISAFQEFSRDMTPADRARFENLLPMLYMIRKIRLPSGVQSNNLLQTYQALMLLSQRDLNLVQREIASMRRDIIVPRFGVREVTCPHCGRVIKNIAYNNLDELLFFHLSVEGFINRAATIKSSKNDSNGSEGSSKT